MFINTTGVVLREVKYKDSTKILTVLTSAQGKLTASAHGAYRANSKIAAATGLLVCSDMTLKRRGERWTLTEASTIEQFLGLREDFQSFALGAYIAELTELTADEDSLSPQLLPLCLNTLYALSEGKRPHALIKTAFELRLMALAGYGPVLEELKEGGSIAGAHEGVMSLSSGAFCAARYVLTCNTKKLFSFSLGSDALAELSSSTEGYLLTHLDRGFKTLDYYKKIIPIAPTPV